MWYFTIHSHLLFVLREDIPAGYQCARSAVANCDDEAKRLIEEGIKHIKTEYEDKRCIETTTEQITTKQIGLIIEQITTDRLTTGSTSTTTAPPPPPQGYCDNETLVSFITFVHIYIF